MSWDEIICTVNGYNHRKRLEWEQTRLISYYSALANLKKGIEPKDLFPIPGENVIQVTSDRETFDSLKNQFGGV